MQFWLVLNPSMDYTCHFLQRYFTCFLELPSTCHWVCSLCYQHCLLSVFVGSFAVVALMTGVTNEAIMSTNYPNNFTEIYSLENYSIFPINPISITMTLTFTVGICEIAAAVLRLGFLTSYFSDPLIAGFTTGAAVHVLVSQLDDVLGVKLTRVSGPGYLFVVIYRLILKIPECNFWTLGASASGGLFLIFGKDYLNPLIYKITGKKIVVPYELLVVSEQWGMWRRGTFTSFCLKPQAHVCLLLCNDGQTFRAQRTCFVVMCIL